MLSPPIEDDLDVELESSKPASHGKSRRLRSQKHRRRRRIFAVICLILAVFLIWMAVSLGGALTNPALGSSASARLAEWFREHGAASVVNWAENEWYSHHPPKVGGALPKGTIHKPTTATTLPVPATVSHLPEPAAIVPIASPPVNGEGQWSPAGRLVDGVPAVYTTELRPSAIHTSFVVGVAWMDTTLLKAALYSGSQIPGGGPFTHTAPISPTDSTSVVTAFNAGFLMSGANGGYYTDGKTIDPLRTGAASFVVYRNGSSTVGQWGRDLTMTPDVVSVRQNLDLLVDNGQVVPAAYNAGATQWGATLGGGDYVWRSGLGVTANGALVYVGGPGLDIVDLANILVRAGAVRAMELDINTDWVNYSIYTPSTPTGQANAANGNLLLPGMTGGTSRYFASWWARDFITMSAENPSRG
jgi:hypothetical protein